MKSFSIQEIKNKIYPYISTKTPLINKRKNKTKFNTSEDAYNINMKCVLQEKEKELYEYLTVLLGKDFTAKQLYNYLYGTNDKCSYCNTDLNFVSLFSGYEKCKCGEELSTLKTNKDIYNYICDHIFEYANSGLIKTLKNNLYFSKVINFENINTPEDLYLYLTGNKKHKCPICGKYTEFMSFKKCRGRHYKEFCSKECLHKHRSMIQTGDKNTCHKISPDKMKKIAKEASIRTKRLIKEGKFTPCVTNSWCHSKIEINYKNNNEILTGKYRSSWEAIFQLLNPQTLYEKIRIPYFNLKNEQHIYIVDFVDTNDKILYEIKPFSLLDKYNNIYKLKYLNKWAEENGYTVEIITEDYFINHKFSISLLKYTDDFYRNKLLASIKKNKFFNVDYEN